MRVLIINTVPTEKNGITNVIFNYLKALNEDTIRCDFVSLNTPDDVYSKTVQSKGGAVYVLPRSKASVLSYWWRIRRLIKKNGYDAVHIHGNSHTVTLELSAAWLGGCKTRIVHCHNTTCTHLLIHRFLTPIFNILYTHGVACGMEAGYWMFGKKNFKVMNNGIDTDIYAFNLSIRQQLRVHLGWNDCRVIGHVGYFTDVKNQTFIVDVFSELYNKDQRYRLLLIGDGNMRGDIENKLKKLGLFEVSKLTGNINNVNDYLNVMDVIVMPSLYEGLPLALIEQQANGLVCVVSDTITREVDKTGNLLFLSLGSSVSEWAKTVMLEDETDREERSRKAIKCITAGGYSIKEEAKNLVSFYRESIKETD